jgi:hypothetical protein
MLLPVPDSTPVIPEAVCAIIATVVGMSCVASGALTIIGLVNCFVLTTAAGFASWFAITIGFTAGKITFIYLIQRQRAIAK